MKVILTIFLTVQVITFAFSQQYPVFGPEKQVEITGLTFDAMEPFITADGNTLFFNSLNSGGNTNLYFATRVNDTVFNYQGPLAGCTDSSPNHLDAVASADENGKFYWVSLRNYPNVFENLHCGIYSSGIVSDTSRVYGDFNITSLGWLIMDASITSQGDQLIYCNSYFDFINNSCGTGVPCSSKLGIAEKTNDTTFFKLLNSDQIFSEVNDTSYLVYAPQVTADGLELYYTRLQKGTVNTEICVSVRSNINDDFSAPAVIYSYYGYVPEAPSPSSDKQKLYYHRKNNSGIFRIFMRYRTGTTIAESKSCDPGYSFRIKDSSIHLSYKSGKHFTVILESLSGKYIFSAENPGIIDVSHLTKGVYLLSFCDERGRHSEKIVIE